MARSSSLKTNLLALALRVARWRILQPVVRFFLIHMDSFLPVDRLYQNDYWVAFHHPQPEYPLQILIVPRENIPSLMQASLDSTESFAALFMAVQSLVNRFGLEECGYRLICNGGPNQSIPQWHWHLISDSWQSPDD
jgi:histidine triad (HIT) family protein